MDETGNTFDGVGDKTLFLRKPLKKGPHIFSKCGVWMGSFVSQSCRGAGIREELVENADSQAFPSLEIMNQ